MCTTDTKFRRDNTIGVWLAIVVFDADKFVLNSTRMREVQQTLTKSIKENRFESVAGQVTSPERQ
ncbi:hypothetical protein D3C76_1668740 [compost metagenome]